MSKVKLLVGIIATLFVVAYAATPVFAQFEAAKALTGKVTATKGIFEGGGGTVECGGAEGVWTLPSKGAQSKELLKVSKWKGCIAKASGFSGIALEVGLCEFELKQPTKATSESVILLHVLNTCTLAMKVPLLGTCTITIGQEHNENLGTGKGKNSTGGWELLAEYAGITDTASGSGCVGLSSTSSAKLKISKVEFEGQKLV